MDRKMLKNSERLTVYLLKDISKKVKDFRFKHRIESISEALQMLIEKGLESVGRDKNKK